MASITPLPNAADYQQWLGYALPATGAAGRAREAALAEAARLAPAEPEAVAYHSQGRLLVIGPQPAADEAAAALAGRLQCTRLYTWRAAPDGGAEAACAADETIRAEVAAVSGYLGAYTVSVRAGAGEQELGAWLGGAARRFDLVLDLRREPALTQERPPPGYFAPRGDAAALARALAELPELVGEFQKPRYFTYDASICAHGNSGHTGCTRCLDVCPTLAIRSLGERIEVDPYLCQGAGSCSALCPTGAIQYAAPEPGERRTRVRRALRRFRELAPGTAPALLFHDEASRPAAARSAARLPEWTLPWPVEEIGSVGLDDWLTALALGARAVLLLVAPATPSSVQQALQRELRTARAILGALGLEPARLQTLEAESDATLCGAVAAIPEPHWPAAQFAAGEAKRTALRLALEHLYAQAPHPPAAVALDAGAPFGTVAVDAQACTLCMSCVGLCPTGALLSGDGAPALRFLEWNCIQCGLCRSACPEGAVTLEARLLLDPAARNAVRLLHEDRPFDCVVCGKPFATQAVITRMAEKLSGHWMYQTPEARRRLQMCEECRLRDLLEQESGLAPRPHPPRGH